MHNIITEKTTSKLVGNVFFGNAQVYLDHPAKPHSFIVSNHLTVGREYRFRAITKCKAGWNTIADFSCKAEQLWQHIGKHTTYVEMQTSDHDWRFVYVTKGGLWQSIDVLLLDTVTVGDIRQLAPKMACDHNWKQAKAKSWADLAFVPNKVIIKQKAA